MTASVFYGDAWELALTLKPGSIDCIVTSPPYFGLRDYGTATWQGGDPDCAHKNGMLASMRSTLNGGHFYGEHLKVHTNGMPYRSVCGKCGAVRVDRQFGLEQTIEEYVARLADLFARLRPALKDCGTIWLNLGDSYAGSGMTGGTNGKEASNKRAARMFQGNRRDTVPGLKQKDLIGVPWRVAFALQADGWYLRSDIIWAKPNPMPESVGDRPTKSHEYVFLLTKSRRYLVDRDGMSEPVKSDRSPSRKAKRQGAGRADLRQAGKPYDGTKTQRNIRTVWTITSKPYRDAHFATMPPELAERCIKAGTSERGVCPDCGRPWVRVVAKETSFEGGSGRAGRSAEEVNASGKWRNGGREGNANLKLGPTVTAETLGWQSTCPCGTDSIPATVLDPFAGSGTTLYVADKLGRSSVGFELNEAYRPLIEARLQQAAS